MANKGKGCSDGCLKKIGIVFAVLIVLGIISCAAGGGGQSVSSSSTLTAAESSASSSTSSGSSAASSSTAKKKAASSSKGTLKVRFVDVGQGDGNVIEFPDGKTMVIDTGSDGSAAVIDTLARDKRTHINWLVATHPDADHIGGLDEVMAATDVSQVWAPRATNSTHAYTNFLQAAKDEGCKIKAATSGKVIAKGNDYSAKLVWPPKGAHYRDTNDMSAVIVVKYGKTKYLFTGDAPVEALDQADVGAVDVLKVSHHGSASGTDAALAASLSPQVAVLSYAADNDYGHPAQTVLDALRDAGAKVYGTAVNGTVTVTSNGSKVSVKTEHRGTVKAGSANAGSGGAKLDAAAAGATAAAGTSGGHKKASSDGNEKATAEKTEPTITGSNNKADERTVYVTPTGKKYHAAGCRTLSRSKNLTEMSESEAEAAGYTACAVCGG
jgi:competence protein ComEC